MKFSNSALIAGLAAFVAADTAEGDLPTPFNAQIGILHFPIRCKAINLLNVVLDGVYTATAPVFAEEGQQIYYTDVTATLKIPQYITRLAKIVKGTSADTKVNVALQLSNASPSVFNVFPNGLFVNGTTFQPSGDTIVRVPKGNGVLPPIGPVTMGKAGTFHEIFLGEITADVYVKKADGTKAFPRLHIECPIQKPDILIGIVNVTPKSGKPQAVLKPANNRVPSFPEQASAQEFGCFSFAYSCQIPSIGTFPFFLKPCGSVFAGQKPGAKFRLQQISATLTAGTEALTPLRSIFRTATSLTATVSEFNILGTNTSPTSLNVFADSPLVIDAAIPKTGNLTLNIPGGGNTFESPEFTAGTTVGEQMYISIGNATALATLKDASGKRVGQIPLNCYPQNPLQLIGILITDLDYPTYSTTVPRGGNFGPFPSI